MPAPNDASDELALRAATDVDAAFPEIVDRLGSAVYNTALRISRQPADAEDLVAETFVRGYAALSRYPRQKVRTLRLRPWLVTILLNLWRNQLRARSRHPDEVALDTAAPAAIAAESPEATAIGREATEGIAQLLEDLPEVQRIAVVLRHVVGLPYEEIAAVLDCPVGTAKSHVSRGLTRLRDHLDPPQEADQ